VSKFLGVSTSGFYSYLNRIESKQSKRKKEVKKSITQVYHESPNAVWVTDITYIYTLSGFVYLTSIMDLYSRSIIGWHLSDSLSIAGVLSAIKKAKANRVLDQPVIIHSDRGSQYVSKSYIDALPARDFISLILKKAHLGIMQ